MDTVFNGQVVAGAALIETRQPSFYLNPMAKDGQTANQTRLTFNLGQGLSRGEQFCAAPRINSLQIGLW